MNFHEVSYGNFQSFINCSALVCNPDFRGLVAKSLASIFFSILGQFSRKETRFYSVYLLYGFSICIACTQNCDKAPTALSAWFHGCARKATLFFLWSNIKKINLQCNLANVFFEEPGKFCGNRRKLERRENLRPPKFTYKTTAHLWDVTKSLN